MLALGLGVEDAERCDACFYGEPSILSLFVLPELDRSQSILAEAVPLQPRPYLPGWALSHCCGFQRLLEW